MGIGTGEQDRVGVAEIAVFKAYTKFADALCLKKHGVSYKTFELEASQGKRDAAVLRQINDETKQNKGGLTGATMVSDAFFPFRDGLMSASRKVSGPSCSQAVRIVTSSPSRHATKPIRR